MEKPPLRSPKGEYLTTFESAKAEIVLLEE